MTGVELIVGIDCSVGWPETVHKGHHVVCDGCCMVVAWLLVLLLYLAWGVATMK